MRIAHAHKHFFLQGKIKTHLSLIGPSVKVYEVSLTVIKVREWGTREMWKVREREITEVWTLFLGCLSITSTADESRSSCSTYVHTSDNSVFKSNYIFVQGSAVILGISKLWLEKMIDLCKVTLFNNNWVHQEIKREQMINWTYLSAVVHHVHQRHSLYSKKYIGKH